MTAAAFFDTVSSWRVGGGESLLQAHTNWQQQIMCLNLGNFTVHSGENEVKSKRGTFFSLLFLGSFKKKNQTSLEKIMFVAMLH